MHQIVSFSYCRWRAFRAFRGALFRGTMDSAFASKGTRDLNRYCCHLSVDQQYEEAVQALNGLQTNAAVLQRVREERGRSSNNNIPETEAYLRKVGVSLDDLDKLSVIHIAGTKGKGSTCAFIESILREHGYRTGFYSSPHLVAVRERIRINGQPIQKDSFTQHFWDVYNALSASKESEDDMPAYFKFLTVLALKVFLREEIDVAVIEVGIGGEYDCTNVIRKPVVCGITTLDLDHTSILGTTVDSIAWHKSGIMKPNIPTFTVDQQPGSSLSVLMARAKEKNCALYLVPPLESYGWGARPLQLGLAGSVQYNNASLALQLSRYWIDFQNKGVGVGKSVKEGNGPEIAASFTLNDEEVCGLRSVVWPGRSQMMTCDHLQFFIDGAHTVASMQACIDWFTKASQFSLQQNENVYRVLLFNSTGDRDPETLLQFLAECSFDLAVFTTNLATMSMSASSDQTNYTISKDQMHLRCERQRNSWIRLVREFRKNNAVHENHDDATSENINLNEYCGETDFNYSERLPATDVPSIIFPCILDALVWLSCGRCQSLHSELVIPPAFPPPEQLREASQVQILVTGSLHLVGGLLGVIDPGLSCANHTRTFQSKQPSLTDLVRSSYFKSSPLGAP
ncbi:folylpolyglutamate synthase, mitochondrial-like [Macrobrachium rosenbergii]|uniref:folylpolyglutamate synthase, mitochondrial-like n=1 Tax=Macrobrachium rosenbergii TaxID=79674 RepID=UPI0034D7AA22